jgi:PAS domain S-box-containing protein
MDLLSRLFDTSGFPRRWDCGRWTEAHGWLHILSDLGVWSAYLAIPIVLGFFIVRRKDLPFRGIFVLFGMFIFACGTTHLMEAIIFWWPAYPLAGLIKLLTALVSWTTVFALIPITPKALAMRSPEELSREIAAREEADAALLKINAELESRVQDRTAQLEKSNAELYHQREWFRATLASIGDAVITTDTEGRVMSLNTVAERLTGWKAVDAHLQPLAKFFNIVDEKTREPLESPIERCLREGHGIGLANQSLLLAGDGRQVPIDECAAPIRNAEGAITGSVLVFRDVSERRAAEDAIRAHAAQLQEADRRKDEFLATLAHELRNPLAPVRNSLQILRLTDGASDLARNARDTIDRQLHHLVQLVDDLLDVSRITRGKLELRPARVSIAEIVQAALETSGPLVGSFAHRLHVELPPEPIWLDADPVRLAQVVANLVNNAAKYTDRGGDIWVTAEAANGEAILRVRDSGVGIPAEMLERVFDLFAQVERTPDRRHGGLGIGLMLVKRLVELHGGTVTVASEGLGRGSEFVVRLPAAPAPNPATNDHGERRPSPTAPLATSLARRILVVDDNRDAADSLARLLAIHGHDITVAYDGPAAIEKADKTQPDVAILDLGLPQMSGHEVGQTLRARPWGANILLIALTGWGQEADKRRTREIGFDYHFVKPVDMQVLLDALIPAKKT